MQRQQHQQSAASFFCPVRSSLLSGSIVDRKRGVEIAQCSRAALAGSSSSRSRCGTREIRVGSGAAAARHGGAALRLRRAARSSKTAAAVVARLPTLVSDQHDAAVRAMRRPPMCPRLFVLDQPRLTHLPPTPTTCTTSPQTAALCARTCTARCSRPRRATSTRSTRTSTAVSFFLPSSGSGKRRRHSGMVWAVASPRT